MAYGFIVFPPLGCRFAVATFDIIFCWSFIRKVFHFSLVFYIFSTFAFCKT